jgi:hypothetical protein
MKYSSRFFLYAPLAVFLAIAAGVGVHWWIVADAFAAKLSAANGHEIAPGVTLRYGARRISGFPFSLDTVLSDVSVEVATPRGVVRWYTPEFAMHALSYGRAKMIFEAAGRQELDWTRGDGVQRKLDFAVGSLHASSVEGAGGLLRFDLDLVGLGSHALTAQRLQLHIRRNKNDTLDLAVMADGLRAASCPRLAGSAENVAIARTITNAKSFAALSAGNERWNAAVKQWRAAGGKLVSGGSWTMPQNSPQASESHRLQDALLQIPAEEILALSDIVDGICGAAPH